MKSKEECEELRSCSTLSVTTSTAVDEGGILLTSKSAVGVEVEALRTSLCLFLLFPLAGVFCD